MLKIFSYSNHLLLTSIPLLMLRLESRRNLSTFANLSILKSYRKRSHLKPYIVDHNFPLFYKIKPTSDTSSTNIDINTGRIFQSFVNPKMEFLAKFSPSNAVYFYTDGSKGAPGSFVGIAIYCPLLSLSLKYRIRSYASIFSAEALAIWHTTNIILTNYIDHAHIFTDSLSTLHSLLHFASSANSCPFVVSIMKNLVEAKERYLHINHT